MSFHLICEVFMVKNQKLLTVEKFTKYDEKIEYFEKKNAFILLKGIFHKTEGRKISKWTTGVLLKNDLMVENFSKWHNVCFSSPQSCYLD